MTTENYFQLLNRCHVNLLPLSYATANNAYLEAHSLGIPTVVSDLATVTDYATSQTRFFSDSQEAVYHLKFYQALTKLPLTKCAIKSKKKEKSFFGKILLIK